MHNVLVDIGPTFLQKKYQENILNIFNKENIIYVSIKTIFENNFWNIFINSLTFLYVTCQYLFKIVNI